MHAQPNLADQRCREKPTRGSDKARPEPSVEELPILRLLSEQVAIPLDQLARFIGVELEEAVGSVQALKAAGRVEYRRFLVRDYAWFWLSHRGARIAGTGFPYREPDVSSLAHRRAVNEIRLYLAQRAPQGLWVCERAVFRRRDPNDHLPDGVFEIDGERHAIEAELSTKRDSEVRRIVAEHSDRYDAVIYFCGPLPYNLLKRVQAEDRWPKLVVHRLPEGGPC